MTDDMMMRFAELKLVFPDVRSEAFKTLIAEQIGNLDAFVELEALNFIEAVSDFEAGEWE